MKPMNFQCTRPLQESDPIIVLLIGDSILNGGNTTEQDNLESTILESMLSTYFDRSVRVLNMAVGSWSSIMLLPISGNPGLLMRILFY